MATYTNRYKFSNPGAGSCNWDYDQKRNRLIYDAVFDQDAKNNTVESGCELSLAAGLSADIAAGVVTINAVQFEIDAGNLILTGATLDPEQYNFISVDETGSLQVSTDPPAGNFVLIGVVDCDVVASVRLADCRNMAQVTDDYGFADNLFLNPDLSGGPGTINQRAFNGDWGSLATYEYGYDRWYKNPEGNITQVIREGNYKPSTDYLVFGDVPNTSIKRSPPSGNFYIVMPNVPTGEVYLIEGTKERPVRKRKTEYELWLCQAYCIALTGVYRQIGSGAYWTTTEVRFIVPIPNTLVQDPGKITFNSGTGQTFRITSTGSTVDITDQPTSVLAREGCLYITIPSPAGTYKEACYLDINNNSRVIFDAEI